MAGLPHRPGRKRGLKLVDPGRVAQTWQQSPNVDARMGNALLKRLGQCADTRPVGTRRASESSAELKLDIDGRPTLEFQPAVDLATGLLVGFEALLRWEHPTKGTITPDVLLPFAEASDRILEIDAWAMGEACRQAALWPSGIQVAVNCSLAQLREHRAALVATAALESSGLHPDRLTLEISETAVADLQASAELRTLSAIGLHLAVDDVGTSWSTLENLRRYAIETAKIDRRFIGALEPHEGMNRAIVEAIIHVGHSIGMSTVAEGVETAQQVAILKTFGADVAQGWFFAGGLSAEDTLALATAEPRAVFSLTSRRDDAGTTSVQPPPLVVLPGEGEDTPDHAGPPPSARASHPSVVTPGT